MNPEIKRKWLEALRSGEYNQGSGALRKNGKFCCLGVLCDLHSKETGTNWIRNEEYPDTNDLYLGDTQYLDEKVMSWAGLCENDPQVEITAEEAEEILINPDEIPYKVCISSLNDTGASFRVIANKIEEQL